MHKGFTLIEVLLVILIIGTLAAAGFSGMIRFSQGANARLVKNRVINLINKARSRALNGSEVDWLKCVENAINQKDETDSQNKKVPEFYGIKFIPTPDPATPYQGQKIEFFAKHKKFPESDCVIEAPDFLAGTQLKYKIKLDASDAGETSIVYSVPFGQFSIENNSIAKKIIFEIYNNNNELLHSFKINANVGIPE